MNFIRNEKQIDENDKMVFNISELEDVLGAYATQACKMMLSDILNDDIQNKSKKIIKDYYDNVEIVCTNYNPNNAVN